ncbi:aminopeptidase P family protein [Aurantibacillus circumpalustris]|uniref:aminopeptidase P family protein n=1 Tax=Aurantibacillus circumpalustris TaxID=3036359 RepID=UPI00295A6DEC|nr:aminopeptidase P family protein [Aurantibacillus circumpalustris]
MKYKAIDNNLFIENRNKFKNNLKPNSLAVFVSNDIMPTNADGSMGFRQNADLFYLSGIDQEDTILVIFPDVKDGKHKEILFVKETSELIAIWEGAKLNKAQATAVSGIEHIYWHHEFEKVTKAFFIQAENIYLNSNEHTRRYIDTETAQDRFNKSITAKYPLHKIERSAPIMHRIRAIKSTQEIDLIQQACDITEKGFRRLLGFIKPGVWEYEIEAELIHEFVRNRSQGFAYGPIVASGSSACVLHYVENNRQCKDGDVILLDVAAEYSNYASDLTRALPVNGKYTKRQKEVYNAVLRVHRAAAKLLVPGQTFDKYNTAVGDLMTEELLKLNLLKSEDVKKQNPNWPAYKKYFMHGTSHFLGLDVHDVGFFQEPIQAGMVFTVEPGIYIQEEGLGIRIENNLLVTTNGQLDLMKNIPIEADEIEELMSKSKIMA